MKLTTVFKHKFTASVLRNIGTRETPDYSGLPESISLSVVHGETTTISFYSDESLGRYTLINDLRSADGELVMPDPANPLTGVNYVTFLTMPQIDAFGRVTGYENRARRLN